MKLMAHSVEEQGFQINALSYLTNNQVALNLTANVFSFPDFGNFTCDLTGYIMVPLQAACLLFRSSAILHGICEFTLPQT